MKLYRGIKSSEYKGFDSVIEKDFKSNLRKILERRKLDFVSYPEELDEVILKLKEVMRLVYQNFTDNKQIAFNYAKNEKGLLIEIDLSVEEVLKYFSIEFQNFSKRRKSFEIVYTVKGSDLEKNIKKWNLVIRKI